MPTDIPTGFGVSTVSTGFPNGDETDERGRVPTGSLEYEHMNSVPFCTRNDIGEVIQIYAHKSAKRRLFLKKKCPN